MSAPDAQASEGAVGEVDLLPCPWCNGRAVCRDYDDSRPYDPFGVVVEHTAECFLSQSVWAFNRTIEDAASAWNARARLPAAAVAAVEGEGVFVRYAGPFTPQPFEDEAAPHRTDMEE